MVALIYINSGSNFLIAILRYFLWNYQGMACVSTNVDEDVLKQYDRIFVLKGGEVYEQGTFDELIGNKEYFYSLYSVTKDET